MDWQAVRLSVELALVTWLVLLPGALALGRWLATTRFAGKAAVEALVVLPLVLPPTVLGYYLLVGLGAASPVGAWLATHFGVQLSFSFTGLVVASVVFNIPFMVQPIELPLAWPGLLSATVLTFVHTLGEFGVVLMMGGNIPGETRTVAIAIYDRVQAFDLAGADRMALLLAVASLVAVAASFFASARLTVRR
jgi:molybdate transport system permease protein